MKSHGFITTEKGNAYNEWIVKKLMLRLPMSFR